MILYLRTELFTILLHLYLKIPKDFQMILKVKSSDLVEQYLDILKKTLRTLDQHLEKIFDFLKD